MKKDQNKPKLNGSPMNQEPEMTQEEVRSHERTRKLASNIFEAIKKTTEEFPEEEFTSFEMVDVFARMIHRYNQEGLKQQYKTKES